MSVYLYKSVDNEGRKSSGRVLARSPEEARAKLDQFDVSVIELRPEGGASFLSFEQKDAYTSKDFTAFLTSLAPLLRTGASLTTALRLTAESTHGRPARLSRDVLSQLEDGRRLSEAMSLFGPTGELISKFLMAGEMGAGIERSCELAADFLSSREQVFREIREALAYPVFIIALSFVVMSILILFVAPALAPVLGDGPDAAVIKFLAAFGSWAQAHASYIFVLLAGLLVLMLIFGRRKRADGRTLRTLSRIPFVGPVLKDLAIGPASHAIGVLLGSGLSLSVALRSCSSIAMEPARAALNEIAERLTEGMPLANATRKSERHLPAEFVRLIILSEKTGNLAQGFEEAGIICQKRGIEAIKRAADVLGPALVIFTGALVAGLMLVMIGSLTSITEGVG